MRKMYYPKWIGYIREHDRLCFIDYKGDFFKSIKYRDNRLEVDYLYMSGDYRYKVMDINGIIYDVLGFSKEEYNNMPDDIKTKNTILNMIDLYKKGKLVQND